MNKTLTVIFDGEVFRPTTPPDLEPNTSCLIAILNQSGQGPSSPARAGEEDAWDVLDRLAGTIDGPPDWSEEHDHYIHGTPKRNRDAEA